MLAKLNRIATQLAKIENIDEAKSLRDKAEALRVYAQQQKVSEVIERQIVVVRLRTERRIGELLAKSVCAGNPQLSNRSTIGLSDVGITRDQSSRWQTAARLPKREFEQFIDAAPTRQLSTNSIIKIVREHERQEERHGPSRGHNIITGDMSCLWDRLDDDSVDMCFTDPPYDEGGIDCFSALAELAASKLKPGGLCLAYSGKLYLGEIMAHMGEHLKYFWLFSIRTGGGSLVHARGIKETWKPVLA